MGAVGASFNQNIGISQPILRDSKITRQNAENLF